MEKITEIILRLRWPIVVLVLLVTVVLGLQLKNLEIDADIIRSLPDDDPDAVLLKRIGENFGGNNMGVIILETDNIYQTHVIEHIRTITDSVAALEGISSITSLTNIINIKGDDFGIEIGKLVDEWEIPSTKEELDLLRDKVNSNEMYRGSVVSEDGTATLIVFTLLEDAEVKQVASSVIEMTESLDLPEEIYFIGSPMLVSYISDLMRKDLTNLLPIAFLLIALILFLSFKSFRGVILPLLSAVLAIIWTLGIMALMGNKMSMISNNIPIILLAVGSAYAIHVLNRINQMVENDPRKAIRLALSFVLIPVILAALTTIIGFVSFIFGAYLEMIVDFGIYTAMGTFFACLLSILFIPAILGLFSNTRRDKEDVQMKFRKSLLSERFLAPLKFLLFKHPKYILTTWTILILASVGGVFMIERSVDIQDYFKKGNPTRKAEQIMIEKFGGTKPVFVSFKGDVQSPEVLQMMVKTANYMEQSPDISSTQSIADLIAEIHMVMDGRRIIPDEADKIEQLWFLIDGNEAIQRFVNDDLDEGILISRFKSPDNVSKIEFARYMKEFIKENSSEDCKIEITGMPFVDITMDRSLVNSQLGSLSIALVFVIIFVGIILRSILSGIYATLPIFAAIIILFGVMGFTGISLNMATVLVASVALGIGIDYSIHVISHFNHTYKATGDVVLAIEDTIMVSGKAIIINVTSVSAGFLVLIFSDMVPLQYFGFLIALSMVGSSLGAITLLPVILILVHRKKGKFVNHS